MGKRDYVEIFTDGSCLGNPGPGGWAAILRCDGKEKEVVGIEYDTTNNRMELMAAIKALDQLKRPVKADLFTDSEYVKQGISSWINKWKKNGWKTASKTPVKNEDLWHQLDECMQRHTVTLHWIKGHHGHPDNERVDLLARKAAESIVS